MQQQLMATDNKDSILLPGDLHIVLAQLRAIGIFLDMTGIPELWIESGLYRLIPFAAEFWRANQCDGQLHFI